MTALLRRSQEFFLHGSRPPQAKLYTWPSLIPLIHDCCAPQVRHIRAYSSVTDSLKIGVRKVQEDIKEGAKKDLVLYLFVFVINMFFLARRRCVLTYT